MGSTCAGLTTGWASLPLTRSDQKTEIENLRAEYNTLFVQIHLHVLYSPHVRVVQRMVEGGAGQRAVLGCVVHAEPGPDITWLKNNMALDSR